MYMQGCPAGIQAGTHWNLIGRSMATLPPVLSPSSILLSPSPRRAFIPARGRFGALCHFFFYFLYNCVT